MPKVEEFNISNIGPVNSFNDVRGMTLQKAVMVSYFVRKVAWGKFLRKTTEILGKDRLSLVQALGSTCLSYVSYATTAA
jgi:hypothetical protein